VAKLGAIGTILSFIGFSSLPRHAPRSIAIWRVFYRKPSREATHLTVEKSVQFVAALESLAPTANSNTSGSTCSKNCAPVARPTIVAFAVCRVPSLIRYFGSWPAPRSLGSVSEAVILLFDAKGKSNDRRS
jgi:hypothetical protein